MADARTYQGTLLAREFSKEYVNEKTGDKSPERCTLVFLCGRQTKEDGLSGARLISVSNIKVEVGRKLKPSKDLAILDVDATKAQDKEFIKVVGIRWVNVEDDEIHGMTLEDMRVVSDKQGVVV